MSDSELLRRLHEREPEAVEMLFEQYLPSVWRLVYSRVGGDEHIAEDLVNETMLALLRTIDSDSSAEIKVLGGWLHTVAIRKVQDHYRAVARVRHLAAGAAEKSAASDRGEKDPRETQELIERRQEIRECVESLPDNYRIILEWKYIENLSVAMIAKRLGLSERAAESLLYRARKAFRDRADRMQLAVPGGGAVVSPDAARSSKCDESSFANSTDPMERSISMQSVQRGLCGGQAE